MTIHIKNDYIFRVVLKKVVSLQHIRPKTYKYV